VDFAYGSWSVVDHRAHAELNPRYCRAYTTFAPLGQGL